MKIFNFGAKVDDFILDALKDIDAKLQKIADEAFKDIDSEVKAKSLAELTEKYASKIAACGPLR